MWNIRTHEFIYSYYGIDLLYTKWDKHGEKDEQATTAQIPVNATIEFVDDMDFDMDFGSEIPTDVLTKLVKKDATSLDNKELTVCPTCGISRWKVDNMTIKVYEKHYDKGNVLGCCFTSPHDSQAWRTIDEKFPKIAKDPRNLRLGISADGVDVNSGTRHHSDTQEIDIDVFRNRWVDDLP
ncbi:hypothetical protein Tco_0756315 [Tanacetum coccineum]